MQNNPKLRSNKHTNIQKTIVDHNLHQVTDNTK